MSVEHAITIERGRENTFEDDRTAPVLELAGLTVVTGVRDDWRSRAFTILETGDGEWARVSSFGTTPSDVEYSYREDITEPEGRQTQSVNQATLRSRKRIQEAEDSARMLRAQRLGIALPQKSPAAEADWEPPVSAADAPADIDGDHNRLIVHLVAGMPVVNAYLRHNQDLAVRLSAVEGDKPDVLAQLTKFALHCIEVRDYELAIAPEIILSDIKERKGTIPEDYYSNGVYAKQPTVRRAGR